MHTEGRLMDNQEKPRLDDGVEAGTQLTFSFGDEAQPELEPPVENEPAGASANAETSSEPAAVDNPKLDLAKIRDLILLAHEDVVPELVTGETFEELLASIEPARQAFQQVADRIVRSSSGANPAAAPKATGTAMTGPIPAGQPGRAATHDPQAANLNPSAKIAEGLRRKAG